MRSISDVGTGIVRRNRLEAGRAVLKLLWMTKRSPLRYFKTIPEIIRLAVMLYLRFPLSLRNVEGLLQERGIKISHETVRFWWNRLGSPQVIVTDKLRSYGAAIKVVGNADRQETCRWLNNRVENSLLPFRQRERTMLPFRRMRSLQKFAAVHASVYNHFNQERSLSTRTNFKLNRNAALAEWRQLCSA